MTILYIIFFLGIAAERLNILPFQYWDVFIGFSALAIAGAHILGLIRK